MPPRIDKGKGRAQGDDAGSCSAYGLDVESPAVSEHGESQNNVLDDSFPELNAEDVHCHDDLGEASQATTIPADVSLPAIPSPEPSNQRSMRKQTKLSLKALDGVVTSSIARTVTRSAGKRSQSDPKPSASRDRALPKVPKPKVTQKVDDLATTVADLEARVAVLDSTSKACLKDVGEIKADVARVSSQVSQSLSSRKFVSDSAHRRLEHDHAATRTATVQLKEDVADLVATSHSHTDTVQDIENRLSAMEADVADLLERGPELLPLVTPPVQSRIQHGPSFATRNATAHADTHSLLGKRKAPSPDSPVPGPSRLPAAPAGVGVLFGPVARGDHELLAFKALRDAEMDSGAFSHVAAHGSLGGYIIIHFKTMQLAHEFVHRVESKKFNEFKDIKGVRVLDSGVGSSSKSSW
ncbi:hypothetical protein CVT26_012898 [Gymnopilus dilepis]|uniref:Uncharacterized protein n=1 Tax=Gymnopilus dilepis TaxID=231916 RepID=A0A409WD87_9AGAR|nr:hypothetical protein CVT26_012898 [Gymnopilus dilepis]